MRCNSGFIRWSRAAWRAHSESLRSVCFPTVPTVCDWWQVVNFSRHLLTEWRSRVSVWRWESFLHRSTFLSSRSSAHLVFRRIFKIKVSDNNVSFLLQVSDVTSNICKLYWIILLCFLDFCLNIANEPNKGFVAELEGWLPAQYADVPAVTCCLFEFPLALSRVTSRSRSTDDVPFTLCSHVW